MEKQHIKHCESEQTFLTDLLSKGTLKIQKNKRAKALQLLDFGKTLVETIKSLQVSYPTLLSWRDKYQSEGLSFLDDKPRIGRPLVIDGLQRAKIKALACSETPDGHADWSLCSLADKVVELGYCEHILHNHAGVI